MSFLVWQRDDPVSIASPRRVFRAAEVPLLANAQALCAKLAQMHHEALALVATASDAARDEARKEGFAAGVREGRDKLAAELTRLAADGAREREALRDSVAALALEVVKKVAGELASDEVLSRLAATAARDLINPEQLTLIVHPEQRDAVRERLAAVAPDVRCEVREDATLSPDACVLETEHGAVDASLDAQLERLAKAWGIKR